LTTTMKRLWIVLVMAVVTVTAAWSQAKKPTIMVVPSDAFCLRKGYTTSVNLNGEKKFFPDYKTAFQKDADMRTLVSAMADFMARNEFPIQSCEQQIQKIEEESAEMLAMTGKYTGGEIEETPSEKLSRVASADILLNLDYQVERIGPKKRVSFNLQAIDAYTSKIISGNTGVGSEANASLTTLLEEAVLSFKDNFLDGLQRYFDDMFINGREITVVLYRYNTCDIDFETEMPYNDQEAELSDIIEAWFSDNTVSGRFTLEARTPNRLKFTQVRIPMMGKNLNGKEVGMDARTFIRPLVRMLRRDPYNLEVGLVQKGLGEVWLTLGDL